ncbi:hypothetical protein N0V95_001577 [Ascochyta clinopodiicola]|nr:hypothetical protein N0V95_001577 [Ascochyta clinopodiicola]
MNNNFNPWAQPFTPNYGYPGQPYDQNRNRNRNQWQTPPQGPRHSAPVASAPWNTNHVQPQEYHPNGQQTYNNLATQQAQAQAYYHQWAQYLAYTQGLAPVNASPQAFGQQALSPYPFFAPSFATAQPHPGLQGVSNNDLQYAFDKLFKGIKARNRRTNVSHRASTPTSDDESAQAVTGSLARPKEYDSLRRVDLSSRINKSYREPTAYPTTKPTGRSRDPKIMLPAPTPTEAYMAQAAEEPSTVALSGRILVILDLNGTLLYRPNRNKKTMIARPFLIPFLRYLFSNFAVMVWSSARPENVASLVEQSLEEDLRKTLVAQWSRGEFNLKPEHYNQNVQVYKNLDIVWSKEEIQQQHPDYANGGRFGQHNTVLIDDSVLKAAAQPHNLLQISEFSATPQQMREDKLREVAGYLEALRTQQDVSKFMRKEHFQHSTGRWTYEWPEKDAATQGTAYQGGELQGKVSMESPSKKTKNKQNKKAKKREAAAKLKAAGGATQGKGTEKPSQAEEHESDDSNESEEEGQKGQGGVKLA